MYRGDIFIDLGTADYLSEKYHKKKQSLLYLSKPVYHRNAPKNSQRLMLYKIEKKVWQNHKKSHKKTYKNGQKIVRLYYHLTKQLDLKEKKALKNENQHKII